VRTRWAPLLILAVTALGACAGDDDDATATLPSIPTGSIGSRPTGSPGSTNAPSAEIGSGAFLVGAAVQPGTYLSPGPVTASCHWERLSGASSSRDDVIAEADVSGQAIVEILPTDVAFKSAGCDVWTPLENATAVDSFGDGDWAVGQQVAPGRWTTDGDPNAIGCQWTRASGFTHIGREVIATENTPVPATVDIDPTDVRFTSNGCGTWTKAP
jgi:hypothetical protein